MNGKGRHVGTISKIVKGMDLGRKKDASDNTCNLTSSLRFKIHKNVVTRAIPEFFPSFFIRVHHTQILCIPNFPFKIWSTINTS